jgi:hypothetical protein
MGRDGAGSRFDLGKRRREIFLAMGLDGWNQDAGQLQQHTILLLANSFEEQMSHLSSGGLRQVFDLGQ